MSTITASKSVIAAVTATPVFEGFVAELTARLEAAECPVRISRNANWVCFESTVNKHKLYVPQSKSQMSWCHTTLKLDLMDGVTELPKGPGSIGKIERFVAPDLDLIETIVAPLFADQADVLRANRKPTPKGGVPTPVKETIRVGTLADIGAE